RGVVDATQRSAGARARPRLPDDGASGHSRRGPRAAYCPHRGAALATVADRGHQLGHARCDLYEPRGPPRPVARATDNAGNARLMSGITFLAAHIRAPKREAINRLFSMSISARFNLLR